MTRTIECPECDGEGRVEVYRMATAPGGSWDTPYHEVKCSACNGTGRIPDEEDDDITQAEYDEIMQSHLEEG